MPLNHIYHRKLIEFILFYKYIILLYVMMIYIYSNWPYFIINLVC
jgi:hypothetical protein